LFIVSLFIASCGSETTTPRALPTFTARSVSSPVAATPAVATTAVPLGRPPGAITTYRFDVTLDYLGHRAQVNATVEAINPGPDTWNDVVFQLPASLRSEVFILNRITVKTGEAEVNASYQQSGRLLQVLLEGGVPPNAPATIVFNYGLAASQAALDTPPPFGNVSYSDQLIQFINWYPLLVPYRTGEGWLEVGQGLGDSLPGDPIFAENANYNLSVTTTDDITVVSGGFLARAAGRWKFSLNNIRAIAFTASDRYQSLIQTESGINITSYFLPEHALAGRDALLTVAQSLGLFGDRFGAYPGSSLVIAENTYSGSTTAGGLILHAGRGYADYSGHPDSLLVAQAVQSTARLWWGQILSSDSFQEPWLNEALPLYSELIYYQEFYPKLEVWYWQSRVEYWKPEGTIDRSVDKFPDTGSYLRNLPRRGALFLRDLRLAVGDDAFFAFLQDYYRNGSYRTITGDDFFNALRRHTDADIDKVLAEYFTGRVMPTAAPSSTPIPTGTPIGAPTPTVHVVQSGENLTFIAGQYGVTVQAIVQANQLADANSIFVGQRLVIPVGTP
jgi:hypothetical protein